MKEQEKQLRDFIGTQVKYDDNGTMIWGGKADDLQLIADVRGWGAIQNLPQFKNDKTQDNMAAFQDALGQFIADAINEKLTNSDRDKFAIEFAEWAQKEEWLYYISDMIWIKNMDYMHGKETKELLQLFHSQKQTQG